MWETGIGWDDLLPESIDQDWMTSTRPSWLLRCVRRCLRSCSVHVCSGQEWSSTHVTGDCQDKGRSHKRLTIPHLQLCGVKLLFQLLQHTQRALNISTPSTFAWTDSTIMLGCLCGNPRRFKTFQGNQVSHILQSISPEHWNLLKRLYLQLKCQLMKRDVCLHVTVDNQAILPVQQFSSFSRLKRVTAWVCRFIDNCHKLKTDRSTSLYLSSTELAASESYWISLIQHEAFGIEIESLIESQTLTKSSRFLSLILSLINLVYFVSAAEVRMPRCHSLSSTQFLSHLSSSPQSTIDSCMLGQPS